jgi:cytoplasmic iron level regulating protein YaaA (DUF328/UPF0246 family)
MSLLILLPPSEGKSAVPGTAAALAESHPDLARDVAPVLKHLRRLPKDECAKWYGVSTAEKASAAHRLNLAVLLAPGLSALERYTGVVYTHLAPATLREPALAGRQLLIVSGMYGLIDGSLPIADYKLPLNPWLTKYWKPINSKRLAALAGGQPVLSLLPGAHAKALDYAPLVNVDFKLEGGKKSAGHFGKAIKGKFVRFLLETPVTRIEDIGEFREEGYRFDGRDFVQG